MRVKTLVKKIKENLFYHFVDSTAMLSESNPPYAFLETQIAGMSNEVSIKTRLFVAGLSYLGLGYVYGWLRDFSRRAFGITQESSEKKQAFHDTLYAATFNALLSPPLYVAGGEQDLEKIVIGTICTIGMGSINGSPMGYAIDSFRDLTGIQECKRPSYPLLFKMINPSIKKGLALLVIIGSIAITAGIYAINPDKKESHEEARRVEVASEHLEFRTTGKQSREQ